MPNERVFTVTEPTQLLAFLLTKMPSKGRNKVKAILTHRQVEIEGKVVTRHDHPLNPGQRVTILNPTPAEREPLHLHGIRILHEDADLMVIDKPPGLLSIATDEVRDRTAYHILMEYVRRTNTQNRVFVVHRLDRETSGVMMFAKREAVQQALQNEWKDVVLERTYWAVVEGIMTRPEGKIESWLKESQTRTMYVNSNPGDGLKAVTNYRVIQAGSEYSLLEVMLETGRKNQIRVHMQSLGHSVVGDKRYGSKKDPLGRMGLHARVLSFRHPVTGQELRFDAGIPYGFQRLFPGV